MFKKEQHKQYFTILASDLSSKRRSNYDRARRCITMDKKFRGETSIKRWEKEPNNA